MTGGRSVPTFVTIFAVAYAVLYVFSVQYNLALFTYHAATEEFYFLVKPASEGPAMYWYGWLATSALQAGDELRLEGPGWIRVDSVEDTGRYETVYNLRVADFHTYFVGCEEWRFGVWAHNTCVKGSEYAHEEVGSGFQKTSSPLSASTPKRMGLISVSLPLAPSRCRSCRSKLVVLSTAGVAFSGVAERPCRAAISLQCS